MKYRARIHYTEADKAVMWDRWQKGDSLATIGRLFDREHSSVQRILQESGGIRPPQRRRSRLALTLPEREEISRGLVTGHSIRSIAALLGRAPSTVCRETRFCRTRFCLVESSRLAQHPQRLLLNWLSGYSAKPHSSLRFSSSARFS